MGIPINVTHTGMMIGNAVVTPDIIPLNVEASINEPQLTSAIVGVEVARSPFNNMADSPFYIIFTNMFLTIQTPQTTITARTTMLVIPFKALFW